jgi:hypothetical protein
MATSEQCRFVHQVGEVRAGKSRRERGDLIERDVGREADLGDMHLQDLNAPLLVRTVDQHLAVEASGAQQRRIEDLGAVGRAEQHHAGRRVEAVQFGKKLVQRLLLLISPPRPPCWFAIRRASRNQMPKNTSAGTTHDRMSRRNVGSCTRV